MKHRMTDMERAHKTSRTDRMSAESNPAGLESERTAHADALLKLGVNPSTNPRSDDGG